MVVVLGGSVLDGVRRGSHGGTGSHGDDDDKSSRVCIGASMQLLLLSFSEYYYPFGAEFTISTGVHLLLLCDLGLLWFHFFLQSISLGLTSESSFQMTLNTIMSS